MDDIRVTIGGKERLFKYTWDDCEEIERTFPRLDGSPGSLSGLVMDHLVAIGSRQVRAFVIFCGLRHEDPTLTVDQVKTWIGDRVRAGLKTGDLLTPAVKALSMAGFLEFGVRIKEPKVEEGKVPAAADTIKAAE